MGSKRKLLISLVVAVFLASLFFSMVQSTDTVQIQNSFDGKLITHGLLIGKPNQNTLIDVSIALKLRNVNELNSYMEQVENPNSPMFHKFITKQ